MNERIRTNVSPVALRTAGLYALAGAAWILLSDHAVRALVADPVWRGQIEIYKGWFFVVVTAALLYWTLKAQLNQLENEMAARRKALDALQTSEERFQLAMRGSNDGLWDWNLEEDTVYLSPRYKEMVGYAPDELENSLETWRKLVHPADLEPVMGRVNEMVAGQTDTMENEFRMRHKEGHWVFILSRAFAIRRGNRLVRLVGTHVDLTARKNAEEALRRQEAIYRTAVNGVREVVFQADMSGHFTFFNSAWQELTGFSAEESLGNYFLEFVHPDERAENQRLFDSLARRERRFCDHTARYRRKDGSFCWVEVHAQLVLTNEDTALGFVGTLQDISERRKHEEKLRKNEEHLRQAAAIARVGTFEHNHLTGEFYLSPVLRELHGLAPDESITVHQLFDWVHPDDAPAFLESVHRALDPLGSGKVAQDVRWRLPNGYTRWLRAMAQTEFEVADGIRRPARTIGAAVDITGPRQAEDALRERETLYRAVIETSVDGFLMTDLEGRILETNAAYIRRSGYGRDELLSMTIADVEAVESRAQIHDHLQRIQENTCDLFESLHRASDGTVWQVEVDSSYWPIAGGRIFSFVRDVNQRKRSEALLRLRLELSEMAGNHPLPQLVRKALDLMELFTSSRFSRFFFVDSTRDIPTLEVGSTATERLLEGLRLSSNEHRLLRRCHESAEPVIENHSIEQPEALKAIGTSITRRLWAPILRQGNVAAVVCLANRSSDYTPETARIAQETAGILMDLVERRRAEEALRESEERLEIAVAAAEIGHWEVCLQTGRIRLSDSFEKLLACPRTALPKNRWELRQLIHTEDRRTAARLVMSAIKRDEPFDVEFRVITADGSLRWDVARGRVVRDVNHKRSRLVGIAMDITQRKLTEEAVARSEERYRAIVETTFDWIWEVDASIRFTFSSPKIYDLLGYRPEEIIGKHYSCIMTPEALARVQAEGARITTPDKTFKLLEAECLHRDGRRVIIECSGVPKRGPNGELLGYRGSSRNITERRLAEQERQALENQLRQAQKMEAIGTLAGGVAHDFNNLLTVIHGNASMLLSPQLESRDRDDCATQIVRAAERAASLTRQLLMFSRKQVMQLSNINLNSVVSNMTKMLQRILGEDITLQTTYGSHIGAIRGDVGMIEQILMNLSVNARDAMPEGGQLNIATGMEEVGEREAQQNPDAAPGTYVWLRVSDTGTGISPEILPHIFEPFFTTKDIGKGTGLGLATIYGIVRQHRGWISMETELKKGTKFKIYFPALMETAAAAGALEASTPLPTGSETILVVEDDAAVRDLMIQLLEHCGYRVLHAVSGRAALELWPKHRHEVQLLLTDLVMPDGITGLQLAERIRKDSAGLPVMYVTGYSPELAAKGKSLVEGVNLLQKPFSPDKLARAVRSLLDGRSKPAGG